MPFHAFKTLENTPLQPIFALVGTESLIRQKMRENLVSRALGDALPEMNFGQYQVGEDNLAKALDACQDYPCFAEWRVVVVSDLQRLKKKAEVENLMEYLKSPQPSTVLILEAEKLDGRLNWVKLLKKQGKVVEIPNPKPQDALAWIRRCFQKEGKKFEVGLPETLLEMIGVSLSGLEQVVAQLCLFAGERESVSVGDAETLLVKVTEENVFEVIEALFARDLLKLHRSLGRLLGSGEAPLKILALIYRHLAILLTLCSGSASGGSSLLRLPPFVRQQYEAQAQRYQRALHVGLLKPLTEADWELKNSSLNSKLVLKNCVERVVQGLGKTPCN